MTLADLPMSLKLVSKAQTYEARRLNGDRRVEIERRSAEVAFLEALASIRDSQDFTVNERAARFAAHLKIPIDRILTAVAAIRAATRSGRN
jgi:hypothetical protein